MHKDLVSKELTTEQPGDGSADESRRSSPSGFEEERSAARLELAYQYLQQVVLELQKEVKELRGRIEQLEKKRPSSKRLPDPQPPQPPTAAKEEAATPSRVERYRSQRGGKIFF